MASSSSTSSSCSSSSSSKHSFSAPPHFTPIQESEREGNEDEDFEEGIKGEMETKNHTTPFRHSDSRGRSSAKIRPESGVGAGDSRSVSCNMCRPTRKSPRMSVAAAEQWKIAADELSHKLAEATRKRDEALVEVSNLKSSMAELEKKLNKLELCFENLNSPHHNGDGNHGEVVGQFLIWVSEARSNIRQLSRSLSLQPQDLKLSLSKNPKTLLVHLEALLNRALFQDFESVGFKRNGPTRILNPTDLCESNFASFKKLKGLTWEEILGKGTRHFDEEFSGFCDRKMGEVVGMLGSGRAWPEPVLRAFFGAAKSVWVVHLLANSVHPGLPILRVEEGLGFDSDYMEDMGGHRARVLVPTVVRVMITPGFYVHGNVVKCNVLCRYQNSHGNSREKGSTPSPL